MEIDDVDLYGSPGIEREIIFHIKKSPIHGNYINGLSSKYIKEDEDDEYVINSYDNMLFRYIFKAINNSLNHEGYYPLKTGVIKFMNDITYRNLHSVNHPIEIFNIATWFIVVGFNIIYKGKYIDDDYYCSVQWKSVYDTSKKIDFGNIYKGADNKHHVLPIRDIFNNNKPIEFTFIAKYHNNYVKDRNSKPTLYELIAINNLTRKKFKITIVRLKIIKQLDNIFGFNHVAQIVRNMDLVVKRFYFPIAHNLVLLYDGEPNPFSKMDSEENLKAEYKYIQDKIARNEILAGEYFVD